MRAASRRIRKPDLAEARVRMYRELVFDSAERVFARTGFRASRMEDIAAEAGISLRTLYATYRGKSELYRQIEETRIGQLFASVIIEDGLAPLPRLHSVVRCYLEFLMSHSSYLRMHLRQGQNWAVEIDDAEGDLEGRISLGVPELAKIFREGMDQGTFHDGDPEVAARLLLASQQILLAGWVRSDEAKAPEQIIAEVVTQIERMFVMRPRSAPQLALA
ncbi:MAG: TetR/AcrR family transcriptional regulator [Deltaproteobacteria bacterium]